MLVCKKCGSGRLTVTVKSNYVALKGELITQDRRVEELRKAHQPKRRKEVLVHNLKLIVAEEVDANDLSFFDQPKCSLCGSNDFVERCQCSRCNRILEDSDQMLWCDFERVVACIHCVDPWACKGACDQYKCPMNGKNPKKRVAQWVPPVVPANDPDDDDFQFEPEL